MKRPRSLTRDRWRSWLERNHSKEKETWLIFYKKHAREGKMSYLEALDDALCYGWIDGIRKRQAGGMRLDARIPLDMTPLKCLSHVLSQPGVCTTIPGVSNVDQLHDLLAYSDASRAEKDYLQVLAQFL